MTRSKEEVEENVVAAEHHTNYHKPTETMPESPPPSCQDTNCNCCQSCDTLASWWECFKTTIDALLLKSNVHKCSSNINKDSSQNKGHPFRGCLDNVWCRCKARFPRLTFDNSGINEEVGGINMKKWEPWLNTFTYAVTYLF